MNPFIVAGLPHATLTWIQDTTSSHVPHSSDWRIHCTLVSLALILLIQLSQDENYWYTAASMFWMGTWLNVPKHARVWLCNWSVTTWLMLESVIPWFASLPVSKSSVLIQHWPIRTITNDITSILIGHHHIFKLCLLTNDLQTTVPNCVQAVLMCLLKSALNALLCADGSWGHTVVHCRVQW